MFLFIMLPTLLMLTEHIGSFASCGFQQQLPLRDFLVLPVHTNDMAYYRTSRTRGGPTEDASSAMFNLYVT